MSVALSRPHTELQITHCVVIGHETKDGFKYMDATDNKTIKWVSHPTRMSTFIINRGDNCTTIRTPHDLYVSIDETLNLIQTKTCATKWKISMDGAKWAFCVESTSKYLGIQSDKTTFLANCNPVTSNAEFIVKNRYHKGEDVITLKNAKGNYYLRYSADKKQLVTCALPSSPATVNPSMIYVLTRNPNAKTATLQTCCGLFITPVDSHVYATVDPFSWTVTQANENNTIIFRWKQQNQTEFAFGSEQFPNEKQKLGLTPHLCVTDTGAVVTYGAFIQAFTMALQPVVCKPAIVSIVKVKFVNDNVDHYLIAKRAFLGWHTKDTRYSIMTITQGEVYSTIQTLDGGYLSAMNGCLTKTKMAAAQTKWMIRVNPNDADKWSFFANNNGIGKYMCVHSHEFRTSVKVNGARQYYCVVQKLTFPQAEVLQLRSSYRTPQGTATYLCWRSEEKKMAVRSLVGGGLPMMRLVLTYAKNNIEATLQMYDGAYVLAYYDDFTVRPVHGTYHQRFPPAFVIASPNKFVWRVTVLDKRGGIAFSCVLKDKQEYFLSVLDDGTVRALPQTKPGTHSKFIKRCVYTDPVQSKTDSKCKAVDNTSKYKAVDNTSSTGLTGTNIQHSSNSKVKVTLSVSANNSSNNNNVNDDSSLTAVDKTNKMT